MPNQSLLFRFDAELVLPSRICQIGIAFRQLTFVHGAGVIGGDKNVVARADPFVMRTDCFRLEIGESRRGDALQQLFPLQRLHRNRPRLDRIDSEAAAARFEHGALQDVVGAAAPQLQPQAVFLLKCLAQRSFVVDGLGGVDVDLAFFLGAGDQACGALRATVSGNFSKCRWSRLCGGRRRRECAGE